MDVLNDPRLQKLNDMPSQLPPLPWKETALITLHGLFDIGYVDDEDLLLTFSLEGRTLLSCLTGTIDSYVGWEDGIDSWDEAVTRMEHGYDNFSEVFDKVHLVVKGIGEISDKYVRVSGIHGGGLPRQTNDGWELQMHTIWTRNIILLYSAITSDPFNFENATKIFDHQEDVIAFGFSETGKSFVIAYPHSVQIYHR